MAKQGGTQKAGRVEDNRNRKIAKHMKKVQKDAMKKLSVPHGTGRRIRRASDERVQERARLRTLGAIVG